MVVVKINTTGVIFEIDSDVFLGHVNDRNLQGKLPELVTEAAKNGTTLSIQRPVASFAAILEYYQTGDLHMPNDCCPASFKKELDFWGIKESVLQECCRIKFRTFFDEQSLLRAFREEIVRNIAGKVATKTPSLRQKIWNVVDNRGTSLLAKIYFGITIVAVIASILGITFGTDKCCLREVTFCEMTEYISFTNTELYALLKEHVDIHECHGTFADMDSDIRLPPTVQITKDRHNFYIKLGSHIPPPRQPTPGTGTLPPPQSPGSEDDADNTQTYTVPKQFLKDAGIMVVEYVTLAFFTTDFILRICACPSYWKFAKSVLNVIDFAALAGSYLSIILTATERNQKYKTNWIDMLDYIQVFRALRLFRLVKNIRTSQVLSFSIRHNMKNMSMMFIFLMIFICIFGTMVFFAEDRQVVVSILEGWWWSVVTLTTVGYGDIVPQTPIGRAVGSICAITGIWLLSMTLPIFVNDFVSLHQYPFYEEDDVIPEEEVNDSTAENVSHQKDSVTPVYGDNIKKAWTNLPDIK